MTPLLLDTHAFLWWVGDVPALSMAARAAIGDAANECHVSIASAWEMAIKVSLGKLRLPAAVERFVSEHMAKNGFRALAIELRHAAAVAVMPFHHRDPFDRLLAAQALADDLTVVTADPVFETYGAKRIW